MTSEWIIPPSVVRWLDLVPTDRPVAMLIRHSVRGHLPAGEAGSSVPLTEDGHRLATELGGRLRGRLRSVRASPLVRTMQTASRLAEGAGLELRPNPDRLLGDPGVYVVDGRAGISWQELGFDEMMRRLACGNETPPGCADPDAAARRLVHHMLAAAGHSPGIHAFATHDSLVTATVGRLLDQQLTREDWPWFLEAAFFWVDGGELHTAYRDCHGKRSFPLVSLTERDAIALARWEIGTTVGLDCPARFFLAGGAFKTLLTGRPPRDLDLWAASDADRMVLRETLLQKGAEKMPEQPYTEGYRLRDRVIELPLKTEPSNLEDRLARFDIALSSVGVEFLPGDRWRASIHPLAVESVSNRCVLLLEELQNWRHSLSTLVRMRQYAGELGFSVPQGEIDRIWNIFDSQSREIQLGMLERFASSSRYDSQVHEEALGRCG